MRRFVLVLFGLAASANVASAQSILERVLGQIDGATNLAPVNGTYANISETIGNQISTAESVPVQASDSPNNAIIAYISIIGIRAGSAENYPITVGDLGTTIPASITGFPDDFVVSDDGSIEIINATDLAPDTYDLLAVDGSMYRDLIPGPPVHSLLADGVYWVSSSSGAFQTSRYTNVDIVDTFLYTDGVNYFITNDNIASGLALSPVTSQSSSILRDIAVIDGSITNIVTGVTAATAEVVTGAGSATVLVIPTVDLGNMSTTVLGAVDTGEITLGVNSAVDEAGTSTTRAISGAVTQIGGSAGAGALVLNLAHNASSVDGAIQNTLLAVNGSAGNLATTTLGAVNTGTITSGVNAAVNGIVGMAGQSGL